MMGRGDNLLATGLARGARARGKRIAFGPVGSTRTYWDRFSDIYKNNPNIAVPGTEHLKDVEWIDFWRWNRVYERRARPLEFWKRGRLIWNVGFRAQPGEMFFDDEELAWAEGAGAGFVLMEPNVVRTMPWAVNKQWSLNRYDAVASELVSAGFEVVQFVHGRSAHVIPSARRLATPTFRHALAALQRSALYLGSEGGMHHGAAAVDVPGVVLFGGFAPPSVLGYRGHANLTGGASACGSIHACAHCKRAMAAISVEQVVTAAKELLAANGRVKS